MLNFTLNWVIMRNKEAAVKLMMELEKGRISGEKEGWHTLEELRQEFGNEITTKPVKKSRLSEMLNNINDENIHQEVITTGPVGKEIW